MSGGSSSSAARRGRGGTKRMRHVGLGPANSLSAVRVRTTLVLCGQRGRQAVVKDVGVRRPPNDGQAAAEDGAPTTARRRHLAAAGKRKMHNPNPANFSRRPGSRLAPSRSRMSGEQRRWPPNIRKLEPTRAWEVHPLRHHHAHRHHPTPPPSPPPPSTLQLSPPPSPPTSVARCSASGRRLGRCRWDRCSSRDRSRPARCGSFA